MGLYRNEQGGFACLTLLKRNTLHRCHRTHRRNIRLRRGNNHRLAKKEQNQCNAHSQERHVMLMYWIHLMQYIAKLIEMELKQHQIPTSNVVS